MQATEATKINLLDYDRIRMEQLMLELGEKPYFGAYIILHSHRKNESNHRLYQREPVVVQQSNDPQGVERIKALLEDCATCTLPSMQGYYEIWRDRSTGY